MVQSAGDDDAPRPGDDGAHIRATVGRARQVAHVTRVAAGEPFVEEFELGKTVGGSDSAQIKANLDRLGLDLCSSQHCGASLPGSRLRSTDELPYDIRKDPAVAEGDQLLRRIDPRRHPELLHAAVSGLRLHADLTARLQSFAGADEAVLLGPRQLQRRRGVPRLELQRQNTHVHQVAAMDALERLGNHRLHAQQERPLRRPVARGSGSVLLTRDHQQRHPDLPVLFGGVVDRHQLAARLQDRPSAFGSWGNLIPQPGVGKRAAHHHLVVAAPRAVRVEIGRLHAMLDQVLARGAVGLDRSGRRDVIRRDAVAEERQHAARPSIPPASAASSSCLRGTSACGCTWNLRPRVLVALGHRQLLPVLVALEDVAIAVPEHLGVDGALHRLLQLLLGRPDVFQKHGLAGLILAERLRREIFRNPSGECVRHHERRRREIVGAHVLLNASLEVAVAAEHRADDQALFANDGRDFVRQRTAVADAGRAAVPDQIESELIEIRREPGGVEVFRDDFRTRRQTALDPRFPRQSAFDGLLGDEARTDHHARIRSIRAARDRGNNDRAMIELRERRVQDRHA